MSSPHRPCLVSLAVMMMSLMPAIAMLACVPASATPVVIERFADGSTGARLDFSAQASNDTLTLEIPRGAQVTDAELSVTGIEGNAITDARVDFNNTAFGDDLWALFEWNSSICPPEVDPYNSGWQVASDDDVDAIAQEDDEHWDVQSHMMTSSSYHYPFQLYHFRTEGLPAVSYTVSWNGYGNCDANDTATYQATMWLYNHTGSSWEKRASYGNDDPDDVWLESMFLPNDAFISSNGSVDALLMGPPGEYEGPPPQLPVWGHIVTDYVALKVGVPGGMEYPQNATLRLGSLRLNLSVGPLEGQIKLDDALGFKDALQAIVDTEVVMPGTIVIPFTFSVQWRTMSILEVGGLSVTYEPAINAAPVWRGPATVEVDEDSPWTEAIDLGTAFSDDWNQEQLRFAIVNVSDPANLSTRIQFGTTGNWTLSIRPAPDFFGEVAVTLNATDLYSEVTPSPALTMRVRQVPDRPSIEDPGELHATEGERFVYTPRASDPDMPDDFLTWSDVSDLLDVNTTTGTIVWTPGKDQIGTHRVQVIVTDKFGLQGTMTFAIVVTNVNDPPVITSPLMLEVDQDQPGVYYMAATDPDTAFGDVLSYFAFSEDIEVQCDGATGEVTFNPTNDDIGTIEISLRVQDKAGLKDDRVLLVTVRNVNDPPVLQDVAPQTHDQWEEVSLQLQWSDPDLSVAGAGERLTMTSDGPAWLRPDASGLIAFTADQAKVGVWEVNYTVTDALGLADTVRVVWTIIDINDPPVVTTQVPATVAATEEVPFVYQLEAMDLDGNVLVWEDDSSLFDIGESDGRISFLPKQSETGTHRVAVTVSDGKGGQATVSFDLVVANVNDAPVIGGMSPLNGTRFKEGEPVAFMASASDADGDALTYIWKEGGKELGRGGTFTTDKLKPGRHTITLAVTDGNATVERLLEVEVKAKEGGVPVLAIVAGIVVVVVIVAVLLALLTRRGSKAVAVSPASPPKAPEQVKGEASGGGVEGEEPPKIEVEIREV